MTSMHRATEIDRDYMNEYTAIIAAFESEGRSFVAESVTKCPIRSYSQRYSLGTHLVPSRALYDVEVLDRVSRIANKRLRGPNDFTDQFFMRLVNKVHELLYDKSYFSKVGI